MRGRLSDAARAMEGVLMPAIDGWWQGATLDSRQIEGGELFFALPGEQTDGHRFVTDALGAGASAAVISRDLQVDGPTIRVEDSYRALHALTREMRRRAPRRLAAITGSAGKTTTKELLAAMLESRFGVGRTPGNFNNLLGFPVALLGIDDDADWMVAEMGMSTPGELSQISRLGRPDVAVFTNVRPAHLEAFGSLRAIARAKAELLDGLRSDGTVVANADDPEVMWIAGRHDGPIVRYGIDRDDVELTARSIEARSTVGSRFELVDGGDSVVVELPLHGRYNVENCLAAAAAARLAGVPLAEIAEATHRLEPAPGRGAVHRLANGAVVIDDSYNSNPAALDRALEAASRLPARRRWAVLGDMLELGPAEGEFHRAAGRHAAEAGFEPIVGVGPLARELTAAADEAGVEALWCADVEATVERLPAPLAGDVVLVKGSRGIGLERVVEALLGAAAEGPAEEADG